MFLDKAIIFIFLTFWTYPLNSYTSLMYYLYATIYPQVSTHSTCINSSFSLDLAVYIYGLGSPSSLSPPSCFCTLSSFRELLLLHSMGLSRTCPRGASPFFPKLSTTLLCLINRPAADLERHSQNFFLELFWTGAEWLRWALMGTCRGGLSSLTMKLRMGFQKGWQPTRHIENTEEGAFQKLQF